MKNRYLMDTMFLDETEIFELFDDKRMGYANIDQLMPFCEGLYTFEFLDVTETNTIVDQLSEQITDMGDTVLRFIINGGWNIDEICSDIEASIRWGKEDTIVIIDYMMDIGEDTVDIAKLKRFQDENGLRVVIAAYSDPEASYNEDRINELALHSDVIWDLVDGWSIGEEPDYELVCTKSSWNICGESVFFEYDPVEDTFIPIDSDGYYM